MKFRSINALLIALSLWTSCSVLGQCNADNLSSDCTLKLSDGFNFLKSYHLDSKADERDTIEFSYVLTKGSQYMINVCAQEERGNKIIMTLLDGARNRLATSKVNGQIVSVISYPCNATGIYYIQYSFDGRGKQCGVSALGFKRR